MAYAAVRTAKRKIERERDRVAAPVMPSVRPSRSNTPPFGGAGTESFYKELCSVESILQDRTCVQGRKMRQKTCGLGKRMESVYKELCSLEQVLLDHTGVRGGHLRFDPLEQQIEEVADKVIDLVETRTTSCNKSKVLKDGVTTRNTSMRRRLLQVKEEISCLTEKASAELQKEEEEEQILGNSHVVSSRICPSSVELVGLEHEVEVVVNWILYLTNKTLETLTVKGMAGIGKTTLVQEAYNRPSVVSSFDTRIMVTIGPNFRLREFLLVVLKHLNIIDDVESQKNISENGLGLYLRRYLERRRYLIVLDDVWENSVWISLADFFPINYNKSRVIFTCRVNTFIGPQKNPIMLYKRLLDNEESWNLLYRIVFTNTEEPCSLELEKIGKEIAEKFEGLPLAIVHVGQLLCQVEKIVENWERVLEDENPLNIGIDDNSSISKSLSLSYYMLPRFLKRCFLYVGMFPKGEIRVSELNELWVIEGLITNRNIGEHTANQWLHALIEKEVVLCHSPGSTLTTVTTCRMHYVFRHLCINIAQKEGFYQIIKKYLYSFPQGMNRQQRLCFHNNSMLGIKEVRHTMEATSSVCSLLILGPYCPYPLQVHLSFRLLKVLNALKIRFYVFPQEILQLACLEYLAITYGGQVPEAISMLQNLEFLFVRQHVRIKSMEATDAYLPMTIWKLKWLRHVRCIGFDLLDPCTSGTSLQHLVTLTGVSGRSCTKGVLARMPNLKKLAIRIELAHGKKETLSFLADAANRLPSLRSLKCYVLGFNSHVLSHIPDFPRYIEKIDLSGTRFPWKSMAAICKLQHLNVLKLRCNAFCGSVWEPCKGKFPNLECLVMEDLDLEVWRANFNRFPKLKRLLIRHCYKLHEIPMIKALRALQVEDCHPSLAAYAKQIPWIFEDRYEKDITVHLVGPSL